MPLMSWFASFVRRFLSRPAGPSIAAAQQMVPDRRGMHPPQAVAAVPAPATRSRPLRVWRVVDGTSGAGAAGRLVMSGRLADVCAELDRLAALEAAAA